MPSLRRDARAPGLLFLAALAITAITGDAASQPSSSSSSPAASSPAARAPRSAVGGAPPAEAPRAGAAPFRGSLGVAVAARLLASGDPDERLRGVTRLGALGALGSLPAVDALLAALEQGSPAGRDPRARLEAVRSLAPHAQRDAVRQFLTRELTDGGGAAARGAISPLGEVLRGTAALALARTGEKRALGVLVNAIVQGGAAGEAAARALQAYPPASLQLLIGNKKRLAPALAGFLGELGDLRAVEALRPMLDGGDKSTQVAAGLALARLGDGAALPKARAWLGTSDPTLRTAAAEILVYLGAPGATGAVAGLLDADPTRLDGLRLAELAPAAGLAPKLAQAIPRLPIDARARAVAAIGRAGDAGAAQQLRLLIDRAPGGELATAAAFALATTPGPEARAALEDLLAGPRAAKTPDLRRLALRAGVVRALVLRDLPGGAALGERLLAALAAPSGSSDRAVAVFGAVALGLREGSGFAGACAPGGSRSTSARCDRAAVHAAARGALARGGGDALAPFAVLLAGLSAGSAVSSTAIAGGVALLDDPTGGALSTSTLAALAEAGGPLSPLAARALASRDDEAVRGLLKRLLEGSDPVVRAHVALGLGRDPRPDGVSLLAGAYRFEDDAAVRRAIVRGLSRRSEAQRERTLIAARDLDPDEGVRSLARAALAGRTLDPPRPALATGVAWIAIVPNDESAAASASGRAGRIVRPDGLAIPVVADPDGVLLVPGMAPGASSVLLAPATRPGDAGP